MTQSTPASTDAGRWRRRARTVPTMLALTVAGFVAAPVVLPVMVAADLVRGRRRLPMARTARFALRYLANDSAEIVLAPLLWAGARRNPGTGIERYRRVQTWSLRTLGEVTERALGIAVERSDGAIVEPGSGPLIVLTRHVSLLDAGLPSLALGLDSRWRLHGVVTREALADPGFDLMYRPLGSVFIDRDDGPSARRLLAGMSEANGPHDVVTLYPEGRLFRRDLLERGLGRLADTDPVRAERLGGLRHVLPPRPGGVVALLDTLPEADVVVLGHVGFESAASMADLLHRAPLDTTVRLMARRVARCDIPAGYDDRVRWLDDLWLDLDAWIDSHVG